MKKTSLALTCAALLLLSFGTAKNAAADAMITITGAVGASACTVELNPSLINLGSHLQDAFSLPESPLTASQQSFSIRLTRCAGTVGEEEDLLVQVTGFSMASNDDIFIPSGSLGNVGVRLTARGVPINNNSPLTIGISGTDGTFPESPLPVTAALISTATSPGEISLGSISVPITFIYLAP